LSSSFAKKKASAEEAIEEGANHLPVPRQVMTSAPLRNNHSESKSSGNLQVCT
jgi:hypothetical protein